MTDAEIKELRSFWNRRQWHHGNLDVMDVNNVPTIFPNMFTAMYHSTAKLYPLFGGPAYSDFDPNVVEHYECWLSDHDAEFKAEAKPDKYGHMEIVP